MPSQDELIEAFKAKAASGKCPWCDANDWKVAAGSDRYIAMLFSDAEGLTTSDGLEAIAFGCKNCGYIQLHQTRVLGETPH